MTEVLKKFSEVLVESGAKITFGIQPKQIERIESERQRMNRPDENYDVAYSHYFWERMGNEFAWHPLSLALAWFEVRDEKKKNSNDRQDNNNLASL